MIPVKKNGLMYYQFEIMADHPGLVHGVFTRSGGVSPPPCEGLNLAFSAPDTIERVRANLDLVASELGLEELAFTGQVHGDRAYVVRAGEGYCPRSPSEVITGYDALITPDSGIGLLVKLADCQGVLLFDPVTDVLAVAHSGWRGSVADILGKTVRRLKDDFGVRPHHLLAGIGPSLGPCCAEFVHYRTELPESFWEYGDDRKCFDFWAISRDQLVAAGLNEKHIETSGMCTKCGGHGFYSYRGEKVTGRFGLVAGRSGGGLS
jgi:polyphenol oxidase